MAGVSYTRDDKIAHIRMDATGGNAFTPELRREMNTALQQYRDDEMAWAAVISAAGDDFCLGSADTPVSTKDRHDRQRLWAGGFVEVWKPTIAAIQGECRGEGLALALSCDLRVADPNAKLSFGLLDGETDPNVVAAWLVPLCGISTTFELLYLGRTLSPREAQEFGLINRPVEKGESVALAPDEGRFPMEPMQDTVLVPDGNVVSGAVRFAEEILQYAPLTRTLQKFVGLRAYGVPYHYAQSWNTGPDPYTGHDRLEGNRAFGENRRPVWTQNWTKG